MNTKIAAMIGVVLIAAALALQFSNKSIPPRESAAKPAAASLATTPLPLASSSVPSDDHAATSVASKNQSAAPSSTQEIIAKIKEALSHSGSRHTYATFSRLSETVDPSNVREVLAFVQTLPKPQEKSMLVSLFIARWAEFEPAVAIAYAQALPAGAARNWALTSAVSG